jgi:hypothetical protein
MNNIGIVEGLILITLVLSLWIWFFSVAPWIASLVFLLALAAS